MFRSIRHRLGLFTNSWYAVGPATMLRNSLRRTADAEARTVDSGFDARNGTDTNGDLTPGEAAIPAERRGTATMYLPTMDQDLDAMLAALPWSAAVRCRATFVDLGSGKGRVVLLAAMRRFREVIRGLALGGATLLANPGAMLTWLVVLGSLLTGASTVEGLATAAGIGCGSCAWFVLMALVSHRGRNRGPLVARITALVSSVLVTAGVLSLARAAQGWLAI